MHLSLYAALPLALSLAACQIDEPPRCGDEKTLQLVRRIIVDNGKPTLDEAQMRTLLKFEFPRATALDEKIRKYSCDAKLLVADSIHLPIEYESQIDDRGDHLVALASFLPGDRLAIERVLNKALAQQNPLPSVVPPTNDQAGAFVGTWQRQPDGDGSAEIRRDGEAFQMQLAVGSENCTGELEGKARFTAGKLRMRHEENGEACTIIASLEQGRLHIEEEHCASYHGLLCSFAGILERLR